MQEKDLKEACDLLQIYIDIHPAFRHPIGMEGSVARLIQDAHIKLEEKSKELIRRNK